MQITATQTEKYIGLGIIIALFLCFAVWAFASVAYQEGHATGVQEGIASVPTPAPTPVPTPTPAPVVSTAFVPYITQFTVLSTDLLNGRYRITTTDGRILDTSTYAEWLDVAPQYTYSATVTGSQWNELGVSNVYLIGQPVYPDSYLGSFQQHVYTYNVYPDNAYSNNVYSNTVYYAPGERKHNVGNNRVVYGSPPHH